MPYHYKVIDPTTHEVEKEGTVQAVNMLQMRLPLGATPQQIANALVEGFPGKIVEVEQRFGGKPLAGGEKAWSRDGS